MEGKTVKLKAFINGELINELYPTELFASNTQSKFYPPKQSNKEPSDPDGTSGGSYILISTINYTDWYANNQGGTTLYYTHSVYNYTTYEYVYVPNTMSNYTTTIHSHSSPQFGSSGGTNNHNNELILDVDDTSTKPVKVNRDASFLANQKINCTYEQLLKNTTIKALLDSFFGDDANYNLNFELTPNLTCNNANNPTGCTQDNLENDGSITIKIDQNYVNNTQTPTLFIAELLFMSQFMQICI